MYTAQMASRGASRNDENPLLEQHSQFISILSDEERNSFFDEAIVSSERRAELWMEQADLGESLVDKYAWAIPDERALRILRNFSPLIEIGCGANAYWCHLMERAGIDVIGFDKNPSKRDEEAVRTTHQSQFRVRKGGPEILSKKKFMDRTLFLCYPDEAEEGEDEEDHSDGDSGDKDDADDDEPNSMASRCLEHYNGTFVIHVGELFMETLSMDQAPWGRSSSSEFQQRLAAEYHCLLKVSLPSWLHTRDTLSVWKRTNTTTIVFAADEEDEDEDDEEYEYRHIPTDERLPIDIAAPCLQHLISPATGDFERFILEQDPRKKSKRKKRGSLSKSNGDDEVTEFESPW